jgi:plasmid stability protein
MARITISLPDELLRRLRIIAAQEGTSMAALVREAVEEKLEGCRPRPRSLGIGESRRTDTARRASEEPPEPRSWH